MGSAISSIVGSNEPEHYRQLAIKNASLRGQCFEQSRAAYQAGNGAKAKELSNQGKEYGKEMDRYNKMARDMIFKANNSHRPPHELDLHGLKVSEALETTRERLTVFVKNKERSLVIIVGQGNNSMNKIAKIKPAVTQLVQDFHVKATPNKPNAGCIYIEPAQGEADIGWIDDFFRGLFNFVASFFRSRS
ncbi:hypothetical protein CPC16_000509 [Podila verticillata]|nr:hypothetical protein BGZ52_007396 [Haplosporangium bisporale]KAF9212603.1 hypothetical protein BGZ59_006545 [Podila verticillata]KAF9375831.1 hypothetical protein CPC16_000509 [Podila verticillata]KAI9234869.1 MAG: hypothetical protein BYD32DRAFT_422585 [Podila humilis]KFH71520.1 hypothetical protein MVEG_01819 [Podila verticillata NRRL 6337]